MSVSDEKYIKAKLREFNNTINKLDVMKYQKKACIALALTV